MGHVLHVLCCTANEEEGEEGLGWSTPLSILWAC